MATIVLLGMEKDLADQLSRILVEHEHQVITTDSMDTTLRLSGTDIVFAGGDAPDYREVIRQLKARRPGLAVVLVNRLPENSRWLDALELGAADYCGAPFEATQMRWLVSSVLRQPMAACA